MPLIKKGFQFEEPKKYKKYSPSENSFKYPLEEKWTIDKIEMVNNKALKKTADFVLALLGIYLLVGVVIVGLWCPTNYECSCPNGRYSRYRGSCDPQDW